MTERIYDALKSILFVEFPKNSHGIPVIYDRIVKNWFSGERGVVPDDISIVITGKSASESDDFYGYRMLEYSYNIQVYISGDDQPTTLRMATEGARIVRNILNNHKRIWVMDLCPVCGKLPTSPEHYFYDTEHTDVFGIYGTESGPTGPAGQIYNNFLTTWYKTHANSTAPGNISKIKVLTSGSGYAVPPGVIISGGGFGANGAAATASLTATNVSHVTLTNRGTLYTATPTVSFSGAAGVGSGATAEAVLATPSKAGIAAGSFYDVLGKYKNGTIPASLSSIQRSRFSDIIRDNVLPIREIFDVQIVSVTYTDEFENRALGSIGSIDLKFKELLPVMRFGPGFSGSSYGYNPLEAI